MKKIFFLCLAALSLALVSCGTVASTPKLVNTSTSARGSASLYVVPVCADLQVSEQKISFFMPVTANLRAGGEKNVIDSAVKEALEQNGDADVLVGLQTQLKYKDNGDIESIAISGYPAKYVNFRNAPEELLKAMQGKESTESSRPSPFGKKK